MTISNFSLRFFAVTTLGVAASSTLAGSVTLGLSNGNDGGGPFNTTAFSITNTSGAGVNLTGFALTVGDTQFNFDQIYQSAEQFLGGDGTQSAILITGDRNQDGAVTDSFAYTFANFGAGVTFNGQWDIDNDNGDFNADARLVLFSNGAAPNAVASFTFSDGTSFDYTFPDLTSADTYTLAIPSPTSASLLGLAGIMSALRRRR